MEIRDALAAGTMIGGEYRIVEALRQDGFCITYAAEDVQLGARVLIKEYFPAEMSARVRVTTVRPRSTRDVGVLSWGRQRFAEEARKLARRIGPERSAYGLAERAPRRAAPAESVALPTPRANAEDALRPGAVTRDEVLLRIFFGNFATPQAMRRELEAYLDRIREERTSMETTEARITAHPGRKHEARRFQLLSLRIKVSQYRATERELVEFLSGEKPKTS